MRLKGFAKNVFKLISECFVQDNDSFKRFKVLGVKKITKIENLKFLSNRLDYDKKAYNLLKEIERKKSCYLIQLTQWRGTNYS